MFYKKLVKSALIFSTAISAMIFSSCKSDIKISAKKGVCSISYSTVLGEALLDTVAALAGEGEETVFDLEEFKKVFSESGLKEVSVESKKLDSLSITANTSSEKKDFISASKIVESSSDGKKVELVFSKERLNAMYNAMPSMMQSYIDMFMAPVFSDEEMTDQEYIELIASVYGKVVADEIENSIVNFSLENSTGKISRYSLRLLDIINVKEELRFSI